MPMYRKIPVSVEVRQFNGEDSAKNIIDWINQYGGSARYYGGMGPGRPEDQYMAIDTLEGTHRADPGDWIIKGVHNEFYPCKPDIFAKTYEEDV